MKFQIDVNRERCKGCNLCVAFCSRDVLQLSDGINEKGSHPVDVHSEHECGGCRKCALMCPEAAIQIYRVLDETGHIDSASAAGPRSAPGETD